MPEEEHIIVRYSPEATVTSGSGAFVNFLLLSVIYKSDRETSLPLLLYNSIKSS